MFSSSSYPANVGHSSHQSQDSSRHPFSHSHSQPFSVAGMSNPAATHSPNIRGGSLSGGSGLNMTGSLGMGDGLAQSRSHYQPGYLMSASQNNTASQSGQRYDEAPIVQTKAKMSHILSGSAASDFGMDSMFETPRHKQRQTLADEDAPPMTSVNDIVNEVYTDSGFSRRQQQHNTFDSPARLSLYRPAQSFVPSTPKPSTSTSTANPIYVIVFGYPPDKYSFTVEYFRSLGSTTEPEQNTEIMNCFRIGFLEPADAMRAVRKSGDVLGGSYMIGVKWADPAQAESLLGSSVVRSSLSYPSPETGPSSPDVHMSSSPPSSGPAFGHDSRLALSTNVHGPPTPTVGTPIRVAPSTSAFRRPEAGAKPAQKPGVSEMAHGFIGALPVQPAALSQSPSKGVLGQVSDLIFGW